MDKATTDALERIYDKLDTMSLRGEARGQTLARLEAANTYIQQRMPKTGTLMTTDECNRIREAVACAQSKGRMALCIAAISGGVALVGHAIHYAISHILGGK